MSSITFAREPQPPGDVSPNLARERSRVDPKWRGYAKKGLLAQQQAAGILGPTAWKILSGAPLPHYPTEDCGSGRHSFDIWSNAEIFHCPDTVLEKHSRSLTSGIAAEAGMNPLLPEGSSTSIWVGVTGGPFSGEAG
jgi:hypothetical protein